MSAGMCSAHPRTKCRFHARARGGAFCWWCERVISNFCVVDGVITEHCDHHTPETETP